MNKNYTLWFLDFVSVSNDEIIFFVGHYVNSLFRADLNTGLSKKINIPGLGKTFPMMQYGAMHKINDTVLLIPGTADSFLVYNIVSGEYHYLPYNLSKPLDVYAFQASVIIDNKVYVFGYMLPEIIVIDINGYDIENIEFDKSIFIDSPYIDRPYFQRDICRWGDSIFVASGKNNIICELCISDNRVIIHTLDVGVSFLNTLASHDGYLYFTAEGGIFGKFNLSNRECMLSTLKFTSYCGAFRFSKIIENELLLFPEDCGNICAVDLCDLSVKEVNVCTNDTDHWFPVNTKQGCVMVKDDKEYLYVLSGQDMKLHLFRRGHEVRSIRFYTNDTSGYYLHKAIDMRVYYRQLLVESCMVFPDLSDYINHVLTSKHDNLLVSKRVGQYILDELYK